MSDSEDDMPLAARAAAKADDKAASSDSGDEVAATGAGTSSAVTNKGTADAEADSEEASSSSGSDSDSDFDNVPLSERKKAKPKAVPKPAANKRKLENGAASKPAAKKPKAPRGSSTRGGGGGGGNGGGGRKKEGESVPKWSTLIHCGVLFPPEYEPHGIKMLYDGKPVDLTPDQEEVATMFAVMKDTDYVKKPVFLKNFWDGFKEVLGKNHVIKSLDKCDFTPIYDYHMAEREKKKTMTKEVGVRSSCLSSILKQAIL
jgi:DNA topoisomerase-1